MAITATIQLNHDSVQAGHPVNAIVTISNSDVIPVTIMTLRPTVVQTGDPIPEDASSVAKASMPLLQAFNNQVPASGSAEFPFSVNCQTPSNGAPAPTPPPLPYTGPDLGAADSMGILGATAVTDAGSTVVTGDLGIAPNGSGSISGFPPGVYSGTLHAADATATQAQVDLAAAIVDLQGRTPTQDLTGQDLGTVGTLGPGVYSFSTSAGLTGTLTLDGQGDPSSLFVFQIGTTLTTATSSAVVLINGAIPGNVFWQVGSSATLGTTSDLKGNILASVSITANTGATVDGRLLANTGAVTVDGGTSSVEDNSSQLPVPIPPAGSGTYDVSCQIEAADGQNLSPTPALLTVTPIV